MRREVVIGVVLVVVLKVPLILLVVIAAFLVAIVVVVLLNEVIVAVGIFIAKRTATHFHLHTFFSNNFIAYLLFILL